MFVFNVFKILKVLYFYFPFLTPLHSVDLARLMCFFIVSFIKSVLTCLVCIIAELGYARMNKDNISS